ncbi:hypothetical protein AcdelDRAFT_1991 [Acidovorax delafieldii 2AN]|uniref:Uncharacterized protein n=1 Tax=Acidovorax delafieldii 2AN TaxID=573060 RepID=C5T511_ACIDE|nr:hypothetical protein [Acidovorax delafieldii]EER60466.1 hypothetical protein AcdelDRAFT_1991 [Acidovorax delafieldii 2AN]
MSQLQADFARIFATNPAAPPPITPEALEALRVRADLEFQQHREASRVHRALQDQQQHNAQMGVQS